MTSVLHVLTRTNVGGPSAIISALLDEAVRTGTHVEVARGATTDEEGDFFAGDPRADRFHDVAGLGRRVRPFDDLTALIALVRLMRRLRPDVVHTHMAKAGALGRLAALIAGVPVRVHTYHGHLLTGYFSPNVSRVVSMVERVLARFATHSVVVGSTVRDDLIRARILSASRSSVIPPCVPAPTALDRASARAELGLSGEGPVIGFVGRLSGIKRPDRFIDLARLAEHRLPEARFVLAGDGPLSASLRAAAADRDNVVFLGWRPDVGNVLAACDIVVLCSDNEGSPVTLIEAAYLGIPTVAARVGSVDEIVEHGVGGVLVQADDVDAYLAAIEAVLSGSITLDTRLASRRAAERFTPSNAADAHERLYRDLLYSRT